MFFYILIVAGPGILEQEMQNWAMLAHPAVHPTAAAVYHTEEECNEVKDSLNTFPGWSEMLNNPDYELIPTCIPIQNRQPSEELKQRLEDQLKQESF